MYSIKKVADLEEVWGLYNEGWATAADENGRPALALWPSEEYAERSREADWATYSPRSIPLDELIEELLPGLVEDGVSIAVFMASQVSDTAMVSAETLLADLENELKKYSQE